MIQFGAATPSLLLIVGADRDDGITRAGTKIHLRGSTDIYQLLGRVPYHRWQVTRQALRHHRRPELAPYRWLLNLITEPEANRIVLENLRKLLRDSQGKVINRPDAVLRSTRDQVARRLAGTPGLLVPRVVRFKTGRPELAVQIVERAGLDYPVILRQAGTHTGEIVGLFDNPADMSGALVADGDHIATEFVDFRSTDGLYRKYRYFFIGRRLIFRHILASDGWNIHARDRLRFMLDRPDLREEEERLFERAEGALPPSVIQTLEIVRERLGLDFFGMDFGILPDGRVVLFEANATMNFFPFLTQAEFAYVQKCLEPAQRAFRELVGLAPAGAELKAAS